MTVLDRSSTGQRTAADADALIEEARRVRRRRYRRNIGIAAAASIVVLVLTGTFIATANGGSSGKSQTPLRPNQPLPNGVNSPTQTAPASTAIVGLGPTAVDFSDHSHGWIASGDAGLPLANPTIIYTTNGGQTWSSSRVPNFAAQSVAPGTRYALGGLVGIHFATPRRGWFFQAGLGWQTNDAGEYWTQMRLPGALVALTSAGSDVWALFDSCPINAVSCPQNLARGSLYHATLAATLQWEHIDGFFSSGFASLYSAPDHSVIVAIGGQVFRRSINQKRLAAPASECYPVGSLSGKAMAGICDVGGGGDASVTKVAVSSDQATTWQPLLGGPPSIQWEGYLTTNGTDAIFYVTGGQTLWRSSTSQPGWQEVLQVPTSSPDEISPVYVQGEYGLALVSYGSDVHWFETKDSGMTWEPVTLP